VSLPNDPIVIGYGSVRWGTACETVSMSLRPILDAAGRAVKWLQYDFTLKFIVGEENQSIGLTTDIDMTEIRAELSRVGLELHYLNVGYGALQAVPGNEANTFGLPTNARDILWGPRPQVLQYKPHGAQSAEVIWSCQVNLAPCPEDALYEEGMLEWNWKVTWAIDRSGYTTRTTSGFARVVGYRQGGPASRQIADQADRLRERIEPKVPTGFRRESRSFSLSEDKARLDYSFSDVEEPPNAPPKGCVQVSASQTCATDSVFSTAWRGTLSATYEVSRDTPRGAAEGMFANLVRERILNKDGFFFLAPVTKAPQRASVLIRAYEASEPEIYGRQAASFRAEYTFVTSLDWLVAATGLWTPIQTSGGDWAQWSASMSSRAWNVRGNAQLKFDLSQDAIIDICEDTEANRGLNAALPPRQDKPRRGTLENKKPPSESSWSFWICFLEIIQTDETIELKPLPPLEPTTDRLGSGRGGPYGLRTNPGTGNYSLRTQDATLLSGTTKPGSVRADRMPPLSQAPRAIGVSPTMPSGPSSPPGTPIIQQRAESTFHAILHGYATRAGHPIIPPSLREVGGVAAVPANRAELGDGVMTATAGIYFGLPEYYCRWQLRYLLAGRPTGELPVIDHPFA
jgi:hypothetical protein